MALLVYSFITNKELMYLTHNGLRMCLLFLILVCLFLCFGFFFLDRVSLCSPDFPGTHSVDQAGLKLRKLPASASQVLGLKACATTARPKNSLIIFLKQVLFRLAFSELFLFLMDIF